MKSRCYRSLGKSEEPHYLSVIFTENDDRVAVSKAHCSCKGGSGGHCNHIFALIFQLNDYSCLNVKESLVMQLVQVFPNLGIFQELLPLEQALMEKFLIRPHIVNLVCLRSSAPFQREVKH